MTQSCSASLTKTQLEKLFEEKRSLRSRIRRELKKMDPIQRSQEEGHVQINKNLYVPRVEDKNSNMRMLRISSLDDVVASSMDLLAPTLIDCNGNPREDVMQATDPVDLIILPGDSLLPFLYQALHLTDVEDCWAVVNAFSFYYDMFLKKYQELVKNQNWKQPLHVALLYSVQIFENERIAVIPFDVPVDALISPSGFMPIS